MDLAAGAALLDATDDNPQVGETRTDLAGPDDNSQSGERATADDLDESCDTGRVFDTGWKIARTITRRSL